MTTAGTDPGALVRDDGVRREIYRDPAVFALEMERIFKRTWVFMAHESELAAAGDYLTMRIGAEPVVVVRGEDGEVRVLVNRCRHRGAVVCERAAGNAKSFRCQYHGWTYRNDGQLVGVPFPESAVRTETTACTSPPPAARYFPHRLNAMHDTSGAS